MRRPGLFNLWLVCLVGLMLALGAAPASANSPVASTGSGNPLFFRETGHTLAYNFRAFWEKNGGLPIFGYPITEVFMENGWPTQYFERARLEWHAEKGLVLGGLLGRWSIKDLPEQAALKKVEPSGSKEVMFFRETGHNLGGGFRDFWLKRGGLPVFGFPLSEEFKEVNLQDGKLYTVQYFERARFEWHSDLPVQYQVELGHLGRQFLAQNPAPPDAAAAVKSAEEAWKGLRPTRVKIPRIKVDVEVSEGGFAFNSWDVPRYSAVHYWPVSGFPGGKGNIIMAAHASFKDYLFYDLPEVALNDEVVVSGAGKERKYKVVQILTVPPEASWVMDPSDFELLTLITCVPFGVYSDRLVVRAVPLT
jgi:LPXTG-site transpeptidase (sortase) family protein